MYEAPSILTVGGTDANPDATFAWSAGITGSDQTWFVHVVCDYGGGNNRDNKAVADIPWNSSDDVTVVPVAPNPAITVDGKVHAEFWGDASYVVVFQGAMVLTGKNRIGCPDAGAVVAVATEDVVTSTSAKAKRAKK